MPKIDPKGFGAFEKRTLYGIIKKNHLEKKSRKVLINSFHLSGHTFGFHPQTQKLEPPCTA